jgi:hypothetical protein
MPNVDANVISFQCPKCGHDLRQTIGLLRFPVCGHAEWHTLRSHAAGAAGARTRPPCSQRPLPHAAVQNHGASRRVTSFDADVTVSKNMMLGIAQSYEFLAWRAQEEQVLKI